MGAEGFWDDAERAAAVSAEHSRASKRLEGFTALEADVADLEGLAEMAAEDASVEAEVEEQIASVERRLAVLEEQRLFSGPYDGGDALVSVNAGAGGTDAQDWAEMVLRMEMRWAESRGFTVELLEVERGRGSGHQVGHLPCLGRERLRAVRGRARRAPARAPVAVRLGPPPPDELRRAWRWRRWWGTRARSRSTRTTCRSTPTAPRGPAGQHVNKTDSAVRITHRPSGIVVQCQNERSQSSNRATAMAMLRAKLLERKEREREEEIAREKGEAQDVNFGSQIRSYVLHPYTMVKDHRTGQEMGDVQRVLDGDLDGFVRSFLLASAASDR